MKMFIKDLEYLQQSFQQQLKKVEAQENDLRIRFQKLSRVCRNILIKLSNGLNENPFPDKECEIYFFKRIKTEIMARYIFYQKVHWFHTGYYKGSALLERKRLEKERSNIERFFGENQLYYAYYRNECTHHDEVYFVRGQYDEKICPPVNHFDPHFSTSFDGMLAEMKARELMLEYVEERLRPSSVLTETVPVNTAARSAPSKMKWTAEIVDAVELGYALFAIGAFNNGNVFLKDIMWLLSGIFQIKWKDFNRTFQDVLRRKSGSTKFLDELKAGLLGYIATSENKKVKNKIYQVGKLNR